VDKASVKKGQNTIGTTHKDRIFDIVNTIIWIFVLIVILYPLWLVIITSVSGADAIFGGRVWLWPVDFTLIGYEAIFQHSLLLRSYMNSILYTTAGTALSVMVTMMAAYSLSRSFSGKRFISLYFVFTMFFTGGLIPQYLMNQALGLHNTVGLMIIINCVSVWNLMIARTYINNAIPGELHEAAVMDGAGHFTYFFRIVLPLSGTIIAVLCVYYGVARWNDFFTGLVYLRTNTLFPLQMVLRQLIIEASAGTSIDALMNFFGDGQQTTDAMNKAEVVKYGSIVISTAPVILLYLHMQKYFVKGVTIGSLKG
jgi:putative aldouronate transport system permease protein